MLPAIHHRNGYEGDNRDDYHDQNASNTITTERVTLTIPSFICKQLKSILSLRSKANRDDLFTLLSYLYVTRSY